MAMPDPKPLAERVAEVLPCVRDGLRGHCEPEHEPEYRVCYVCKLRHAVLRLLREMLEEAAVHAGGFCRGSDPEAIRDSIRRLAE